MRKSYVAALATVLVLGLAGCGDGDDPEPGETAPPTTAPPSTAPPSTAPPTTTSTEPDPTPSGSPEQLSRAELADIFTGIQFVPGEYESAADLVDSVYPGLEARYDSCLLPFGIGWEKQSGLADAPTEFGPSNDRSMTAVVTSAGDDEAAAGLTRAIVKSVTHCGTNEQYTLNGAPVKMSIEEIDTGLSGTSEDTGWQAEASIAGQEITLIGMTARVDGNVLAIIGWDPQSNTTNVPQAAQMFVDEL